MMFRWVPISLMLLAQVIAAMTPVCFVRCIGPDGHACVQLAGSDCHCCELAANNDDHGQSRCCDKHQRHDSRERCTTVVISVCDECGCQHSLLETAPSVAAKSVSQTMQTHGLADFDVVLTTSFSPAALLAMPKVGFRDRLLRPQVSARLTALATIVLRV